ncbi:hypothetical protein CBM2604_A30147 [Cupriavidus taiwanensis]|nr:hypothetical protein CBM2604_A30147 [Cupriavidus taiwanensis]SOZ45445.1 hypothetical protein CBM2610_A50060 [Cupriavidus taiwanensis]
MRAEVLLDEDHAGSARLRRLAAQGSAAGHGREVDRVPQEGQQDLLVRQSLKTCRSHGSTGMASQTMPAHDPPPRSAPRGGTDNKEAGRGRMARPAQHPHDSSAVV